MTDWVETDPAPPRAKEWLHVPTGVELFVREATDGFGVCIRATETGPVDRVSIGDPETGRFRSFDERDAAVDWADEWKDTEAVLEALEAADRSASDDDGA